MTIFGLSFFQNAYLLSLQDSHIFTMAQVLDIGDDMSLPKDTLVYEKKIDEKIAVKCFYDAVIGACVTRLYKPDNLDTGIGLRMRAMRLILVLHS